MHAVLTAIVFLPLLGALIAGLFASGRVAVGLHEALVLPTDAVSGTGDAAKVLRIRFANGEQGIELLQVDQAKAPEHHRQGSLLLLGLAQAQGQGALAEAELMSQQPHQGLGRGRLARGADHHGQRCRKQA